MGKKQYSDKDLLAILTEVEVEFKKHLNPESEGEKLAKSEENASNSQENETVKAESFDYDEEDVAEMEKMYKSMSKAEAEAHYKAIKKAAFGGETSEEIKKSEDKVIVQEDTKVIEENKLLKSENETIKGENEELKKSLEKFTQILSKVFGKGSSAPKQKAITEIEVIKKSEEDTKKAEEKDFSKVSQAEINAKLSAKVKSGDLKKSDKEAIIKYFDNKSIELVKHLL